MCKAVSRKHCQRKGQDKDSALLRAEKREPRHQEVEGRIQEQIPPKGKQQRHQAQPCPEPDHPGAYQDWRAQRQQQGQHTSVQRRLCWEHKLQRVDKFEAAACLGIGHAGPRRQAHILQAGQPLGRRDTHAHRHKESCRSQDLPPAPSPPETDQQVGQAKHRARTWPTERDRPTPTARTPAQPRRTLPRPACSLTPGARRPLPARAGSVAAIPRS